MPRRALVSLSLACLALCAAPGARSEVPPAVPGPAAQPPPCPTSEDRPDVAKLLTRTEQTLEGRTLIGTMKMSIKTAAYTRNLKLKVWSKGDDFALVRVLEGGAREVGMMTLKREKQLWNYLPQAGRVMKLPSGMLGDSWMGSDFTNDDLVQGSSITRDYAATIEPAAGAAKPAWRVVLVPKKDAVVVWSKVEMIVDRATCLPLRQQFFDEDGVAARTMEMSDVKQIGWRQFPTTVKIIPADPTRATTISYDDIAFDVDIPDDTFSVHRLQQGR